MKKRYYINPTVWSFFFITLMAIAFGRIVYLEIFMPGTKYLFSAFSILLLSAALLTATVACQGASKVTGYKIDIEYNGWFVFLLLTMFSAAGLIIYMEYKGNIVIPYTLLAVHAFASACFAVTMVCQAVSTVLNKHN